MENQEIILQMNTIFQRILKKADLQLTPETTAKDVEGWDSFTHMMLIDGMEKHFGIKFKLAEIMNFKNVGDTVNCIAKKLNK